MLETIVSSLISIEIIIITDVEASNTATSYSCALLGLPHQQPFPLKLLGSAADGLPCQRKFPWGMLVSVPKSAVGQSQLHSCRSSFGAAGCSNALHTAL